MSVRAPARRGRAARGWPLIPGTRPRDREAFAMLLGGFVAHLRFERRVAVNTLAAYSSDLEQLGAWLARRRLGALSVTREQLEFFLDELAGRGLGSSSLRRKVAALRAFYRYLLSEELLAVDPSAKLPTPARGRPLPMVLRQVEVARLLEAPAGGSPRALRDRALLELLYACGLRISEAADLGLADVDAAGGEVRVRGKGGRERLVPVGRGARAALGAYLRGGRPLLVADATERHVFVARHGCGMTRQGLWKIIGQHAETVGLADRMTPHTLRHSMATHLLTGGCPVRVVQELLGHRQIGTTQLYTHLSIEDLKDAYYRAHPRARLDREAGP